MKYARLFSLVILTVFWASAGAQTLPQFNIVKPSTTGVPGEEVRVMKFDPAGNLWAAGRFYFWGEAALGMLSADQLDHHPLPGGGFDTGAWKVWSSVHHPIPSPYINDMEFGAGGVIWIASDGGLTRFDPAAPTEAQRWFTFTPANSPLILNDVRSLALDSQGNLWLTNVSVQLSNGALFRFNPTSNVWTQYRVGQELPWSPPWYNVNAVLVGADDRRVADALDSRRNGGIQRHFLGTARFAVSDGRNARRRPGQHLGHQLAVRPLQMEWIELAELANGGRHYHDDRFGHRSGQRRLRLHLVWRHLQNDQQ